MRVKHWNTPTVPVRRFKIPVRSLGLATGQFVYVRIIKKVIIEVK